MTELHCEVLTHDDGSSTNPEVQRGDICGNKATILHAGINWCDSCYDIWHEDGSCHHSGQPIADYQRLGSVSLGQPGEKVRGWTSKEGIPDAE